MMNKWRMINHYCGVIYTIMDYHSPTPVSSLIISNIFLRFFAFPSALWQISIPQILWIEINLPEAETFMKRND